MKALRFVPIIAIAFLGFAAAAQGAGGPRYGGTLILPVASKLNFASPAFTTDVNTHTVGCKIFNGLAYLDRVSGNMKPELAESWTIAPDGMTYTFRLRKNVKWHDGKPMTSADVKYTFDNILAKYHPRSRKAFANVSSVETPDAHTVVVRFKKAYAPFLRQMTCMEGGIMPKHIYEGTDPLKNPHNFDKPIGTGPFVWSKIVRGSHIELVRNKNYFIPGKPYLDKIIVKVIPDGAARVLALETGEIDFIQSYFLPKQEAARLAKNPKLYSQKDSDTPGDIYLFFNTTRGPWAKAEVRRALMHAINFKLICDRVSFGLCNVPRGPIDSRYRWASDPNDPKANFQKLYPYDPKRANELLDKAGYPRKAGGTRFSIKMIYMTTNPLLAPSAEVLRTNWKDAGVDVILEPVERQVMIGRVYKNRDFDVTVQPFTTAGDPAIGIHRAYQTNHTRRPFVSPTGYSNPRVDDLLAKAASAPDLRERGKYYKKVAPILARDMPTVLLLERGEIDFASKKFRNIWVSGMPYDKWDGVWFTGGRAKP